MLNLLTAEQTRQADIHTIQAKGISSIDLMEIAARAFVSAFKNEIIDSNQKISIYCGTGNNGGDGLAIARLLIEDGYKQVSVKIVRLSENPSEGFNENFDRLQYAGIIITEVAEDGSFPKEDGAIIIDALVGAGLNKPLIGYLKELVEHINALKKTVISVDVPTGFPSEGVIDLAATTIKSNLAISFQRPKINFFFPESAKYVHAFKVVPIGLLEDFIQNQHSGWKLIESNDVHQKLKPRISFSHKGTYGHALILAGSEETMGAALLCADACLHSGSGITTAYIPKEGLTALNSRSPEVVALIRTNGIFPESTELIKYQSLAVGPGLGKGAFEIDLFIYLLKHFKSPMILDADALNILAERTALLEWLPANCILTPHMKEFDRMFGSHTSWWDRIETARKKAVEYQIVILLKSQYSFIVLPDGEVLINPTGNPAMAIGGMGDVLTGTIAAFLAQGYKAEDAAILGCYIHGKAGDFIKKESGMFTIPPRYIIEKLPEVIASI